LLTSLKEVNIMQLEGQRFSQYLIKSLLDSGGMSKVYLANDTHLNRLVAIKVMSMGIASPDIQLADFGVVKFMNAISTPRHTIRGTPIYMAPEQWRGEAVPATDQYALGVMVYELLTGRPPFQGENQQQILYQHIYVQPQPLRRYNPHIPEKIESVVMKALKKRPENRYESSSAFARAFRQALLHGDNLHVALTVDASEAEYGTRREVTLPEGRRVVVSVPPGAFNGQLIRLDGLGERTVHGGLGALIVTIFTARTAEAGALSAPQFLQRTVEEFDSADTSHHSPRSFSRGKGLLLVALAIVLVLAGFGSLIYSTIIGSAPSGVSRPGTNIIHSAKTPASQFTSVTTPQVDATPQPNYSATATATAAEATATASSIAATATTVADQSQATATAYAGIIMHGNHAFDDPLLENSLGKNWDVSNLQGGGGCGFMGDGYHSTMPQTNFFSPCFARATDFANFSYQVQMTILKGDRGGISFRANADNGNFYYFYISSGGSYALQTYENYMLTGALTAGSSAAIKTGLNQPNLIAIVANGNILDLYVNMQLIARVSDGTYIHGQIGVVAEDINNPTDIVFTNAQVWTA
jgi:eukaryotic-like serine/threonine-protein kinase